jgi:hypothetical protein
MVPKAFYFAIASLLAQQKRKVFGAVGIDPLGADV